MSRIGRLPITVPSGVSVTVDGSTVRVEGARATLQRTLPREMSISVTDGSVQVERPTDGRIHRSLHGLTRTLVANMVEGVSAGFTRHLELVGVGYRASKQGGDLLLNLGYSHPIRYSPPQGITIEVPQPTQISIAGADKEVVGQVVAKIRSFRPPEPYKGKGVLFRGERIRRKAGKSGKAGKGK